MNVDQVREYCLGFDHVTEKLQWGDALCFKVREKMFAVLGLDRVRLTFKCAPEAFAELIERPDIRKAPYLGHRNWVMLDRLDALPHDELQDFLRQSYEMVVAKAPGRKTWPQNQPRSKKASKKNATKRTRKKALTMKLAKKKKSTGSSARNKTG